MSNNKIFKTTPSMSLYELEKKYIIEALIRFGGNKTSAAKALGISIKTLYNKLNQYDKEREE